MDIEIKTWLYDILNGITEIESFFEDQPKEFSTYKMTQGQGAPLKEILKLLARRQIGSLKKQHNKTFKLP